MVYLVRLDHKESKVTQVQRGVMVVMVHQDLRARLVIQEWRENRASTDIPVKGEM